MGNLIVKDNALIEASHKLGEVEQRLILLAILKAREVGDTVDELKDRELIIHANDYIKTFGVDRDAAYKSLKKAVLGLFEAKWGYKYLEKGEKRVKYERFTQSADYGENSGTVKFMFSSAIIPMLVELEKRFTVYEIEQVAQLSSGYAMRLYEFFMQHLDKKSGKGWLEISLDDLRFRFGLLPTEYRTMCDFKRRVLDYSINEINNKTDLSASYEQRKKGRVITDFRFEFTKKQTSQKAEIRQPETQNRNDIDLFDGLIDIERQLVQERIDEHIKRLESKGELISDFYRSNITKKAIAERWGLDVLAKKQKQVTEAEQAATIKSDWDKVPDGTKYRHEDGTTWIKEDGGFFHCIDTNRTAPPSQAPEILTSGKFVLINNKSNEMDFKQPEPEHDEMAKYKAKIDAKLVEIQTMPNGQLFQASDRTVYEKRGDVFYNITHTDGTRPRSLLDAARCWSVDSWKPIDKMPEPSTPSRIFKHYATEQDILADRAKGLNPMDFLTDDERKEVNEIIEEYQENKDPEIYEFIVNILGIQLEEPKKSSLMARLKRQN